MSLVKKHEVADTLRRFGERTIVRWIPYGRMIGIAKGTSVGVATATLWKFIGDLGHLISVDDISMEAINEEKVMEIGNRPKTVNEGYQVNSFNITTHANSIETVAAFIGQDILSYPAVNYGKLYDKAGLIMIDSYDADLNITASFIIPDLNVRLTNLAGVTADGLTNATIEVFSDAANVWAVPSPYKWSCAAYWDNGAAITNAAAPDGVLANFDFGDSNNIDAALQPIAISLSDTVTSYLKYIPVAKYNTFTGGAFQGVQDFGVGEITVTPTGGAGGDTRVTATTVPSDGTQLLFVFATLETTFINNVVKSNKTGAWDQWQKTGDSGGFLGTT